MTRVRRVALRLAALCLCCHLATLAMVPLALHFTAPGSARVDECTCEHSGGVMCPMHHKPARGSTSCAMQAAGGLGAGVLAMLVGTAGVMPGQVASAAPSLPSRRLFLSNARPASECPVPPDPPPPRG